jgi:hypothetical protein
MDLSELIPDTSKMRLTQIAGGIEVTFDGAGSRKCGSCQLCCRVLPVPQLHKKAGQKCRHQSYARGCTIYANRPEVCRLFSCRWLIDPDTADLSRPDRSGYVIDPNPDEISMKDNATGAITHLSVIQIWVDPHRPNAHRDPALRAYLVRMAEAHAVAALVRFDSVRALVLFAPCLASDGVWHEVASG